MSAPAYVCRTMAWRRCAFARFPLRRPRTLAFAAGVLGMITAMNPVRAAEDPQALADERRRVQDRFPAAFAPVTDVPGLPRVLLIGDSISIGYTPPVRALLAGVANVHRIPENGGATTRGLQQLDRWLGDGPWDVIHLNFGLHDIARRDGTNRSVSPDDYEANVRALIKRLRHTGARLIFATTTPVPPVPDSPPRRNADVRGYNQIARRVMRELGVPVNDLYAFIEPDLAEFQQPNNVHFIDAGYRRLAEPVAASIAAVLPAR